MQTDATFRELIARYNRPGPRYTSYPPAVYFSPQVPVAELSAHVGSGSGPLSLYFHLPFCESLCWFCGCNTITTRSHSHADAYLDLLERELELTVPLLRGQRSADGTDGQHHCVGEGSCMPVGRPVVQLHFGGGTPNFLTVAQILRLGAMIRRHFRFAPDAECGVELDPRRLSREQVEAFAQIGMNRASFGVQDCDTKVQEAIHRSQSTAANANAIRWLRQAGFQSVNVDLIYGLPHQTLSSFSATLDEVLALGPDRFAVFSYAHVPWLRPAQKLLERGNALPGPEQKVALLSLVLERLCGAGYRAIGMDHFARPEDELCVAQEQGTLQRNFQGYSTRADCEIVAFGLSSISQTPRSYRQNVKDMNRYRAALEAGELPVERGYVLSDDDVLRRTVIMRLMCDLKLDFAAMGRRLGVDFRAYFAASLRALEPFAADGLVQIDAASLTVTPLGRWFIRNIAMCFDATLSGSASGTVSDVKAAGTAQGGTADSADGVATAGSGAGVGTGGQLPAVAGDAAQGQRRRYSQTL